ncbi:RICIN domain-containing protein [Streptomyces sp. b84]|uniref:RICIN domain-containing protein n=1 Tax=Streptomyces sp. b84 TaxID=1827631 RepID=UPI000BF23FC5|nr:RICIN domain-containing protein [Streptomyces sp. b84]
MIRTGQRTNRSTGEGRVVVALLMAVAACVATVSQAAADAGPGFSGQARETGLSGAEAGQGLPPLISPQEARRISASADPARAAADAYRVKNDNSGKCLAAQGSGDSTPTIQFDCSTFADQYWYFVGDSYSNVQLRNFNSGKCLLVRGGANGAIAVQYPCLNYPDQKWDVRFDPNGNGHYMLANRNSGKCLVDHRNGSNPYQFSCNSGYQDQWWHTG